MKKIYILINIIIFLFIAFLIILIYPRNYKITYYLKDYEITEEYLKEYDGYNFIIKYNNVEYPLFINNKYSRKRKYIEDITNKTLEDESCLNIKVFNNTNYICSKNSQIKTINTMSKNYLSSQYNIDTKKDTLIKKYKNIKIYNLEKKYLVWNYKGFYQIGKNISELNVFSKDNYKNFLSYQTNQYLLFPDYDSEYYFNKIYVYNTEEDILNDINFDYEISYDSYFLGYLKEKVYLLDKKNKDEYEINLKNNSINKISKDNLARIYNNTWQDISINKLINEEIKFTQDSIYNYRLENDALYIRIANKDILVTNKKVKKIIYQNMKTVYYLVDNMLYSYEYNKDEKLLLISDEWNFNYNNHIFIFN